MKLFLPYGSLDTKKKVLFFVLLSLCLLALVFIFYNSSLPSAVSGEQSEAVGGAIESVLPEDSPIADFLVTNIRVTAHFAEFFLLGALVSLTLAFFSYRPIILAVPSVISGVLIGLADETVQYFSARGPEILDVWGDAFGYFTAAVAVNLIYLAVRFLGARAKKET